MRNDRRKYPPGRRKRAKYALPSMLLTILLGLSIGVLVLTLLLVVRVKYGNAQNKAVQLEETLASETGKTDPAQEMEIVSRPESEAPAETERPVAISETEKTEETESPERLLERRIQSDLDRLSTEEKTAQLFIVLPESLTGTGTVTMAGDVTREAFNLLPVGGFVYMEPNLKTQDQIRSMTENVTKISLERVGLPALICVDEEGGSVSRINGRGILDELYIDSMQAIGLSGDPDNARDVGRQIGRSLKSLGINTDFAPVADILTNPDNTVIGSRSFGSSPDLAARMVKAEIEGMKETGTLCTIKHFPGHGGTGGDTHLGMTYTSKTLNELMTCELIPFQAGIEAGADLVMMGHFSAPAVTGDDIPCSCSEVMVTEVLRGLLGFDGVVITDAMNMGAIAQLYSSGEAAVRALKAGCDIVLMPADLQAAYEAVLSSIEGGEITEERLDESVRRILRLKYRISEGTK